MTRHPAAGLRARRATGKALDAQESTLTVPRTAQKTEKVSTATVAAPGALRDHWEIWLPARLGPWRKRTTTVAGHTVSGRVRRMELPPTQNDRLHHQAKARWVKE